MTDRTRAHLYIPTELRDQVDAALGEGQSRNDWIVRAIRERLDRTQHQRKGRTQRPSPNKPIKRDPSRR